MLATLDELSKATRAAPPLPHGDCMPGDPFNNDPFGSGSAGSGTGGEGSPANAAMRTLAPATVALLTAKSRGASFLDVIRDRRSASPARSRPSLAEARAEFLEEIAQRKTEKLQRIEITGFYNDHRVNMRPVVERLKQFMVAEGLSEDLFELKTQILAPWDDPARHRSVEILYHAAEPGGRQKRAQADDTATAPRTLTAPTGRGRPRQSYVILEDSATRGADPLQTVGASELSQVERRSLDIIAYDARQKRGANMAEITITGYARDLAESMRPKLEAMADYLTDAQGLKRQDIKVELRRLDSGQDNLKAWDRRVEIDIRDVTRTPRHAHAGPSRS
ncbi:hypothetical protein [Bordetella sp. N]|uniref:hypothetical protein n=1 Tax=Bordetella sp. N TaxID=1746199 RepID=UPI0012E379B5|nr:hypothetical protein [Bordetella sp. N]